MKLPATLALEEAARRVLAGLHAGTGLWVAVSGGRDSVTLLHILARLRRRRDGLHGACLLGVVHVNHGLRGKESDGDAQFVAALAREMRLACETRTLAWPETSKVGQARARAAREEIYAELLAKSPAGSRIVTAHHRDDQAETVLFRILRGTSVRGLRAMAAVTHTRVRPFLYTSHSQIQSSATELKLSWKEDSSNRETTYERNWLRREVLPLLEARRPGVAERLAALAEEARAVLREGKPERSPRDLQVIAFSGGQIFRVDDCLRAWRTPTRLADVFVLPRRNALALFRQLRKGHGLIEAPGKRFWISCGFMLLHGSGGDSPELELARDGALGRNTPDGTWASALGTWRAADGNLRAWEPGHGRKSKRALLEARVPEFLRRAVPLLIRERAESGIAETSLLLPQSWEKPGQIIVEKKTTITFVPSSLAKRLLGGERGAREEARK